MNKNNYNWTNSINLKYMLKTLLSFPVLLFLISCNGKTSGVEVPEPEPRTEFSITDYGAVPDDLSFLNTEAINSAIEECHNSGGGRVLVPEGVWHTGPITLLTGVELHIDENGVILFTNDVTQYPLVITRWEGIDCYNYQPMIYAYRQQNISITGKGIIDGGATIEHWWPMSGKEIYG